MAKTKEPKQKIRIKLRAFDYRLLDKSVKQIVDTVERTGAVVVGPVPLPTERSRYSVLRSPNIDKDSQEAYEIRVHKRLLDVLDPAEKTIDELQALALPAGVDVELKIQ